MRLNTVILSGTLTSDPAPGGGPTPLATFVLSFQDPYGLDRGGGGRRRDFIAVVAFGNVAETSLKFLKKGSKVVVDGRLREDRWGSPASGGRSRITVVADQVHFVSGMRKHPAVPAGLASSPPHEPGQGLSG